MSSEKKFITPLLAVPSSSLMKLLVAPPLLIPDARVRTEQLVDRFLQGSDLHGRIDFSQKRQSADRRPMGFDEAQETARVVVAVAAPNPQSELIVLDGDNPAPILRDRFQCLEPFRPQATTQ